MNKDEIQMEEVRRPKLTILRVTGPLDSLNSMLVEKKVFEIIEAGQHNLILNLEQVDYLNSSGLRMLFSTHKKLSTLGKMVITTQNADVLYLLKLTGMDKCFTLYAAEEEALRRF